MLICNMNAELLIAPGTWEEKWSIGEKLQKTNCFWSQEKKCSEETAGVCIWYDSEPWDIHQGISLDYMVSFGITFY